MNRQRGFVWWIYMIAALAVLGTLSFIVYKIHHAGYESGKAEIQAKWDGAVAEQRAKEQQQVGQATTKLEAGNVKAKVVYKTITRSVDKYIDRPVYRNVCFDTDGLRDANAALRGPNAPAGEPSKPVSGSDAARGRDGGRSVEEANRER